MDFVYPVSKNLPDDNEFKHEILNLVDKAIKKHKRIYKYAPQPIQPVKPNLPKVNDMKFLRNLDAYAMKLPRPKQPIKPPLPQVKNMKFLRK